MIVRKMTIECKMTHKRRKCASDAYLNQRYLDASEILAVDFRWTMNQLCLSCLTIRRCMVPARRVLVEGLCLQPPVKCEIH